MEKSLSALWKKFDEREKRSYAQLWATIISMIGIISTLGILVARGGK